MKKLFLSYISFKAKMKEPSPELDVYESKDIISLGHFKRLIAVAIPTNRDLKPNAGIAAVMALYTKEPSSGRSDLVDL